MKSEPHTVTLVAITAPINLRREQTLIFDVEYLL